MAKFTVGTKYRIGNDVGTITKVTRCYVTFEFEGGTARYLKRYDVEDEYIKGSDGGVYFAEVDSVEDPKEDSPAGFAVGMQFGSVEVSKRNDRVVYLKCLLSGLTTKQRVKTRKGGGEYIDMDIGTCEWLGITDNEEFYGYATPRPDKYHNGLVYRLSPRGGGQNG